MFVILQLSDEFSSHYQRDGFVESLERIRADLMYYSCSELCSGNYEIELLDELIHRFPDSHYFSDFKVPDFARFKGGDFS